MVPDEPGLKESEESEVLNESTVQSGEVVVGGVSVRWSGASDIGTICLGWRGILPSRSGDVRTHG